MGLPLGLMAWAGWAFAGWQIFRRRALAHLMPWAWITFFFAWQGGQAFMTMRYYSMLYGLLVIFAAWLLVRIVDCRFSSNLQAAVCNLQSPRSVVLPKPADAKMSVSGRVKPSCSRALRRGRGTRLARAGGMNNLVLSNGADTGDTRSAICDNESDLAQQVSKDEMTQRHMHSPRWSHAQFNPEAYRIQLEADTLCRRVAAHLRSCGCGNLRTRGW